MDRKQLIHKSFISADLVPISGGFLIITNLVLFNENYLANIFFAIIFFLGVCSDLLIIENPKKKILIQFFIVVFFLLFLKVSIFSTKIFFIDFLIQNKIFAIFLKIYNEIKN